VIAESLEPQLAAYFGVKDGVLVRSVNSGSAAEKAGIKAGDVILKVDETKVTNPREISGAIREAKKKTVSVALMRERKETTLTVTLPEEPEGRSVPRSTQIKHIQ
jgi:serine protease Do